ALLGVVKELDASPTLVVQLGGFTDPKGTKNYNYALAQRRVEAVRRFLAEKGVQLSRVHAIGMGSLDDPAIPDDKKRPGALPLMIDPDQPAPGGVRPRAGASSRRSCSRAKCIAGPR